MTRTVSARIPNSLHDKLCQRCNLLGDSNSDFVTASIEFALHNSTDYDFDDEIVSKLDNQKEEFENKSEKYVPEAKITRISYDDGKTWINLQQK